MSARKVEPIPVAPTKVPEHVFAPNRYGPRDHHGQPTECLFTFGDGKRCQLLPGSAVHKTSQELVETLPPKPDADRSDEIIGEGRDG